MRKFNTTALLDQLKENTLNVIHVVEDDFASLDADQLNWKPSEKQWSVLECLDHMNIAVEHYLSEVDKKLKIAETQSLTAREEFKSGLMGNYFVGTMTPTPEGKITNKMDTFKKFKRFDISKHEPEKTIKKFIEYQKALIDLIDRSRSVDLEKVRVKSAIGGWLMFRLGDAFRFVVGHNQRHIIQAQNMIEVMKTARQSV